MRKLTILLALALVFSSAASYSQSRLIKGTVSALTGATAIDGATVTNKTTKRSVATTNGGNYSIPGSDGDILEFTFVGYQTTRIIVGKGSTNVTMVASDKQLEEVMVTTAYGIQKSKRSLGYQTQQIDGDEISDTRRENFFNSLAGKVAGITVTPSTGSPGASTSIMLRGAVSLDGNNQPLLVVDGVPYDNQTFNQENMVGGLANRNTDYGNRGMDINPEDIESLVILKGPEASALYGSEGASGALIITTRKGKKGKATVAYDNSFKAEKVYRFPEIQQVYGRGTNGVSDPLATTTISSISTTIAFPKFFGDKYKEGTKIYDNIHSFFKTGFTQNHNLSLEGGSDIATFRLSGNYLEQDGITPNTRYSKYSARLSSGLRISQKINLNTSMTYTSSNTKKAPKGTGSYLVNLLTFPSDMDVTDYLNPDESRKLLRTSPTLEYDNPFWDVYKNSLMDKVDRFNGSGTLSFDPFKWWNISITSGLDFYSQIGDAFTHPQSRAGVNVGGYYSIYEQVTRNTNNQLKFLFKKTTGDLNHTLIVGASNDDRSTEIQSQDGNQFYEINFRSINNTLLSSRSSMEQITRYRLLRGFANYTLSYKAIAYLSLAGSSEGNSTLKSSKVEKKGSYNFGSASLAFVFSDLQPLKELSWLKFAKGRVSYGTTGKGVSAPYKIDESFTPSTFTGGGYQLNTTAGNRTLQPEFSQTFEYGGELTLFGNRFTLDLTRYNIKSKDQIMGARVSYGTGAVLKYINGGEVTNKGIEVLATVEPVKTRNFVWKMSLTYSYNRGVVTKMPAGLPTYYNSDTWALANVRSQMFVGAANGNLAGYISARNTEGKLLISPSSGLPTSVSEFINIGNRQPDYTGGIVNRMSYKAFSMIFTLDIRKGGQVFNGNEFVLYHLGLSKRSIDRDKLVVYDGVLQDGMQNTKTPTKNTITINPLTNENYYASVAANPESQFVETVNWLRMRDITLVYSFPANLLKRQKLISAASLFVTCTDLFMITNYSGADPSVNINNAATRGYGGVGIDYGAVAAPRGINVGCKVKF